MEGGRPIPWSFEVQAARTPGAIALVFAEREVTFRQLDERAWASDRRRSSACSWIGRPR
jgi:non-ribosomal peptide synthetase component F